MIQRRWQGAMPETFSARWVGYLTVARAAEYTFRTTSDDGSLLSIDNRLVVDNGGVHGPRTQSGVLDLEEGPHLIVVDFMQRRGGYELRWEWSQAGRPFETVPAWALTPERTATWLVLLARGVDVVVWPLVLGGLALTVWSGWRSRWTVRHPRLSALALFFTLAVAHTWPMVTDLAHLSRMDNRDTILNQWILAWVAHQSLRAPLHLFDANIFYPERHALAFSEAMITQSAMGAPFLWLGASPVLTYNLLLLAGFTLNGWAMSLVIRNWTGLWSAGLVSGCVFAFCSHALTRIPHMQAQHVEFLPVALMALDSLLNQPRIRKAIQLACWCVLQGLASIYLLATTMFAIAAAILARPGDWSGRRFGPAAKALAITALLAGLALMPFLLPYYSASQDQGVIRSLADATRYSASWKDYLLTPARVHSGWSRPFAGGTGLFPGAIGLFLAGVAIFRGVAFRDPRARMCLVLGVVGVLLSFGPNMPGYSVLYAVVPILQGIRATARFGFLATVAVAILAGFGVRSLRSGISDRMWPATAVMLVIASAFEPFAAPLGLSRFEGIAPIYDRVPRGAGAVVVEIPFFGPRSAQFHAHYMLNSTRNWQPIVNGYSGFQPGSYYRHAEALQAFPDDRSMAMLREIGVTHVFVHTTQIAQDRLDLLPTQDGLELVDTFGETELYRVVGDR